MRTKIFIGLVLLMFLLAIFMGGALAANKSSHTYKASVVLPLDGAEPPPETYAEPTPLMYESMQPNCEDIHPDSGVTVIQHDQWASTYYDYQSNGSMGRMIAVGPVGHRHTICHETRGVYGTNYPRYVTYNCKDPLGNWLNPSFGIKIDGGTNINAGYANIGTLHDGRVVVVYHKLGTAQPWATSLIVQDSGQVCSSYFTNKYDMPDSIPGSYNDAVWPYMGILYDATVDTDYIHVVATEGSTVGGDQRLTYQRCHLTAGGNLVCETPGQPAVVLSPGTMLVPNRLVGVFGEVPGIPGSYPNTISAIVVTSPVSRKVAIVFTNKRQSGSNQYNNDVYYFESTSNGAEWLSGTWPPTFGNGELVNITNYPTDYSERAYTDVSACYDYNDHLHIVWNSCYYDSANELENFNANLMHWTDTDPLGIDHASLVAPGYWDDGSASPGTFCRIVCKMSISALDPIYHPGGSPDSVYLFCIWTQFD